MFEVKSVPDGGLLMYCEVCGAGRFIADQRGKLTATDYDIGYFIKVHKLNIRSFQAYMKIMLGTYYDLLAAEIPHALEGEELLAI